ncbi:MAG: Glycosyl transferase family 39, partial [Candidatus Levybacteria bacterium GW2011_GWA2_36_13]
MKFNIKLLPLFLVILVAIFFRFYQLGSVPPQPTVDEVSLGYNAYSILNTGSDEYGTRLPVLLRAYDDYRPALYSYLAVPFVKFFGLNVVSVRLPSVVLSVLTVVAVYFLTRYLTNGIKPIQLKYLSLDVS